MGENAGKEVKTMPKHGCRNMYWLTGQPGWMRFGYSPGWVGRSPTGLGPCAEYLQTGRWPFPQGFQPGEHQRAPGFTAGDERSFLKAREEFLSRQLEEVRKRLEELDKE
jgi:hypothetical protein